LTAPLWRFAVSCVLHRCLVPRHSLRAFSSLTLRQNLSTFQRSNLNKKNSLEFLLFFGNFDFPERQLSLSKLNMMSNNEWEISS
ncbi:hypothetical protein, partial [Paracholeplasma manati]